MQNFSLLNMHLEILSAKYCSHFVLGDIGKMPSILTLHHCQNNHIQIVIMSVSRETCGQRFGVFIITTMLLPCNWPQGLWIIHLLTTEYEAALLSRESDWQILWYSQCHVDSTFKLVLQNFLLNICRFQSILDIANGTWNCDHNSYFMYWKCYMIWTFAGTGKHNF